MKLNIWNIHISLESNSEFINYDLITPSAHSLHTNWRYWWNDIIWSAKIEILHELSDETLITIEKNFLRIKWNLNFWNDIFFNPQFLFTWNKWLLSKFISHINEKNWVICMHACAIHNEKSWRTIIWIWWSWWWKTALISVWIEKWWKIIWTEMIQIDSKLSILPWNTYDAIPPPTKDFFMNKDLWVKLYTSSIIKDQTWSKCLADFSKNKLDKLIGIDDNCEIVFLDFWNKNFSWWKKVTDYDMALRFLLSSASEKLQSANYLWNNIYDLNLYWNSSLRNELIHIIKRKLNIFNILGWWIDSFRNFIN